MKKNNFFTPRKIDQRFLLIGGFLGAGKTSLIGLITKWLERSNRPVALITNDQGEGLMDTASAYGTKIGQDNVAEITGGCFCCRIEELVGKIRKLDDFSRPEVMIAEPVGSCTDLVATVLRPLEKIYQTPMTLAPLSVVLDARRALGALGGKKKSKRSFHRDVGYVYRKQLEEAEWLVVNKIDLLDHDDLEDLKRRLTENFPKKRQFFLSAKTGEGLKDWFGVLLAEKSAPGETMDVDYDRYAGGEAMLGWVNLEGTVSTNIAAGEWLQKLGKKIAELLDEGSHEVGHFKMSLEGHGKRWRVHQVMGGDEVEFVEEEFGEKQTAKFKFLVNLRAEGDAAVLQKIVHYALAESDGPKVDFDKEAAFQPGKPEPTHRIGSGDLFQSAAGPK